MNIDLINQFRALTERDDSLLQSIASTEGKSIRITADRLMYGGAP